MAEVNNKTTESVSVQVAPDREMAVQSLVLALLVQGRTVIDSYSLSGEAKLFAETLQNFGLTYQEVGGQLVLEGVGFQYKTPTILPGCFSFSTQVLIWALASKDSNARYTIFKEKETSAFVSNPKTHFENQIAFLKQFAGVVVEDESETQFAFHFSETTPSLKKNPLGFYWHLARNFILLQALVKGETFACEERMAVRDAFSSMLVYFGANITYEVRLPEFKDEIERRLAKARGIKTERSWVTTLSETKILTAHDYFLPGDSTEALAYALAFALGGNSFTQKTEKFVLKNVVVSSGRASAFNALKRLGVELEIVGRRERYGEAYGDILVKALAPGKRLQGCHFSGEAMAVAVEELPILALAACFAEKETIFHLPESQIFDSAVFLEQLAFNLRLTGAEIGIYEEGLVIRGKEEPETGDFDCGEYPVIGLALSILAALVKIEVPIAHVECVDSVFPQARENLFRLCSKKIETERL